MAMANKIVGKPQMPLTNIYTERTRRKAKRILADGAHPLSSQFELLKSGRHFRAPLAKGAFKRSFISNAIGILNSAN